MSERVCRSCGQMMAMSRARCHCGNNLIVNSAHAPQPDESQYGDAMLDAGAKEVFNPDIGDK